MIVTLNAAMTAYSVVAGIVAAAQGAVNLAFLPVVAVILAIVAVIAVLAMNWDTVKKVAGIAADWIREKWDALCSWLKNAWSSIGSFFSGIGEGIKNAFAGPINWIASKFEWLADKVRGVFDWIGGAWNKVSGWVSGLFGAKKSVASASASYMAQPMRAYQASRAIDPTATATPLRARASAPGLFATTAPAGAAGVRPASVTVNISVDAHGNLDNDKVAGEIVASLDRWAKVRGRELAL